MTCMNLCLSWLTWSSNLYNYQENKHKTEFVVTVSYIEIYMEELRDLLDVDTSSKDMYVREDDKGNTGIMTYLCVWVSLCLSVCSVCPSVSLWPTFCWNKMQLISYFTSVLACRALQTYSSHCMSFSDLTSPKNNPYSPHRWELINCGRLRVPCFTG